MWEKTLIESNGYGRRNRKQWTIPVAALLHVAIVVTIILASYWHVQAMEAPASNMSYFHAIQVTMPPPQLGTHSKRVSSSQPKSNPKPAVVQPAIIPPLPAESTDTTEQISSEQEGDGAGQFGDPEGVEGGVPDSSGPIGIGAMPAENEEPRVIKGEVIPPVLIKRVEPAYPRAAVATRLEGLVILEAIITKTGTVEQVKTIRSDNPMLERSALEAVLQWRYKPATLNGQPIKVYFTVTVMYHMR